MVRIVPSSCKTSHSKASCYQEVRAQDLDLVSLWSLWTTLKALVQKVSLEGLPCLVHFHHAWHLVCEVRYPQIARVQDEGSDIKGPKFLGGSREGEMRSEWENQKSFHGGRA